MTYTPAITVSHDPTRGLIIYRGSEPLRCYTADEVPHMLMQIGLAAHLGGVSVEGHQITGRDLKVLASEAARFWLHGA